MEQEIIAELEKRLHELIPMDGIDLSLAPREKNSISLRPDFTGQMRIAGKRLDIAVEVVPPHKISLLPEVINRLKADAGGRPAQMPVIVGRYFSPQRQKQCREARVNFIDLSGNVFLHQDNVYVERVGFANRYPEIRKGRGPFSDKASLILRVLLSEKRRRWGVREMAERVGLDPGFVSRMAREIESRGYAARVDSKIELLQPKQVLEDWVRTYSYRKNRSESFFCLADSPEFILDTVRRLQISGELEHALGLHAGAALVAPHAVYGEVHIYVSGEKEADFFITGLKLRKVSQGANVILLFPFYKRSVFWDVQKRDGLKVTSDLQLFLDLYNYPLRGREQAEHLFAKRLKKKFEG
jgi:hypothetical protein